MPGYARLQDPPGHRQAKSSVGGPPAPVRRAVPGIDRHGLIALQRAAGNQAVAGLLSGRSGAERAEGSTSIAVQRWWNPFKKKKPAAKTEANKRFEETGRAPPFLMAVTLAVKTGTETRGDATTRELVRGISGHTWLEFDLGPQFRNGSDFKQDPEGSRIHPLMLSATREDLERKPETSLGFYPDVFEGDRSWWSLYAQQLLKNLPGVIESPEGPSFHRKGRANKAFLITDVEQGQKLFRYIRENQFHSFNHMRFNCTDFAVKALKAAGFSPPSEIVNRGRVSSPNLLYARLYELGELGDQSVESTGLTPQQTEGGRSYDEAHVSPRARRKLATRQAQKHVRQIHEEARQEVESRDRTPSGDGGGRPRVRIPQKPLPPVPARH